MHFSIRSPFALGNVFVESGMADEKLPTDQAGRDDRLQTQTGREAARGSRAGARPGERGARTAERLGRDAVDRGGAVAREGFRTLDRQSDETARQMESVTGQIAAEADSAAQDFVRFATLPHLAAKSVEGAHEMAACVARNLIDTNGSVTRALIQKANPAIFFDLHRTIWRQLADGFFDGHAELLRVWHRAVEEGLQPMEATMFHAGRGRSHQGKRATVGQVMTQDVKIVSPDDSVQEAARLMDETDAGALPVAENDRLIGMLTDRDIALRVVAQRKNPAEIRVRDVMTKNVKYCFEDEAVDHVTQNMGEQRVRRLPVVNREKRLVGIISLGDVAGRHSPEHAGYTLGHVSRAA
jgi:CBS domain-containing protein